MEFEGLKLTDYDNMDVYIDAFRAVAKQFSYLIAFGLLDIT